MRRLVVALLALLAVSPASLVLEAGTALAAASGPALVPGALDGTAKVRAGSLDASDRWIVVLRDGSSLDAASTRARALGIHEDRQFNNRALRGYSARLTGAELSLLRADPRVETVVPDDIVSTTGQTVPTGVSRVYGRYEPIAPIDGKDTRVDADVAIVDTGIDPHHVDLNVVGGINCSTSDTTAWYDSNGHGTHVAGTVGALDNGIGVVGVAPGVRLWAVRILNSEGNGLLSWYVCGLDWIAAQKDPADPTRPLFDAVNMSVQKPGHDDHNCGYTNGDVMHRAVCRVVNAGITVVAAAGNNRMNVASWIPAAYSEVITVSALADTDGRPGGLGGHACYSWGGWDKDDTFADFSNYGGGVDLIAPGKCILSTLPGNRYGVLSGTSMAAPLVTGAAALWKSSRPLATPAEVKAALIAMGNYNWNVATDPDKVHEPLLDVSWIVNLGDFFVRDLQRDALVNAAGATLKVPMNVVRAEDFTLPVDVSVTAPAPVTAALSSSHFEPTDPSPLDVTITVPPKTPSGDYPIVVTASDGARERTATVWLVVDSTAPVAHSATVGAVVNSVFGWRWFRGIARWSAAADAFGTVTGYMARWSVDGRAPGPATTLPATARSATSTMSLGHSYALQVRARDAAGNWSAWVSQTAVRSRLVQDTSSSITRRGRWSRTSSSTASGGTVMYSRQAGASYTYSFRGRGIAIVAPRGPGRATFDVWIDGVRVAAVNQYAAKYTARLVLFATQGLASRVHTLRVVARSVPTRQRIDLDALIVLQ
ncbi:MAG TPA: S8 family serine peptidase [Candidatus Limnocylindrales bacterium]